MVYQRPLRSDELMHFGIKGMHWGIRRYQNEDGSYTAAGRKRYGVGASAKGNAYRALSKVYSLNEKTYNKLGNKTLASMNKVAKDDMLKKADAADKAKQDKYDRKQIDYGINSFKPIQNKDQKYANGKVYYSKEAIDQSMAAIGAKHLNDAKLSDSAKAEVMKTIKSIKTAKVVKDENGKYVVAPKRR